MTAAERDVRGELERLGLATASELRRRSARRRSVQRWTSWSTWALALAAFALALQFLGVEWGGGWRLAASIAGIAFGVPLVVLLTKLVADLGRPIDARAGLARLDLELASEGRLQAAHEFAASAERSPFMAAAIEDASAHVERARAHHLVPDARDPWPTRAWLAPLAALALCVVLGLLPPNSSERAAPAASTDTLADATDAVQARRERAATPPKELVAPPRPPETEARPHETGAPAKPEERTASREPEREAKESGGKTGEGRSAQATPTSSSANSRGFVSSQAQPSTASEPGKQATKKHKPPKKDDAAEAQRKKLDQPSGSTAGTGVGSGSSKNPGSTDWQSKDQISSDEEEPLRDEDQVDDETDESEARGGLQPSLRDRRPAVNRDLTIGFGNQLNPDANGRGGPSERKKSRGVASLVLGVPIPDPVKGDPNPGRTKITQERVEPRPDDAPAIEAGARSPRAAPIGPTSSRELTPWMRELVRSYFLKIRQKNETKS